LTIIDVKPNMHIAFISQYFYPEQFSNNSIALNFIERGHDVDVFSCVPNYPAGVFFDGYSNKLKRTEVWNEVNINRVYTAPRGQSSWQLLVNYLTYPLMGMKTVIRKKRRNPDIIFVSMPSPIFQALLGIFCRKFFGGKLVYWVQDIWPESLLYTLNIKNKFLNKLLMSFCGWVYRRADIILVQNQSSAPKLERFGIDQSKIDFLPNTAPNLYEPKEAFSPCAVSEASIPEGFRIMFAGNVGESQDFDTIIEAARILKDKISVQWLIVGSGRDLERVKRKVKSSGLEANFHFLGRHPESAMPAFFTHADAMLVSLKDNPIFNITVPYKVQCYMACGKPIIASLNGEGAQIIKEAGAGVCAPSENPEALSSAVFEIAKLKKEELNEIGVKSHHYYLNNFSPNHVYTHLENVFQNVLG